MISRKIVILLTLMLPLAGFQVVESKIPPATQPGDERAAQNGLPQSKSPLWSKLAQCGVGYNEKTGLYSIHVVADVKALEGQTVSASGFVLPLDGSDKTKHFLLTKRTPVCLFCPPGEPNEVIEVHSKQAIDWNENSIAMSGQFKLVNDGEKGVFFELVEANKAK